MRIAIIAFDNREDWHQFSDPVPFFGPAPDSLLLGMARQKSAEVHVLSCSQRPLPAPEFLNGSIRFHQVVVPKWGWMRGAYVGCIRAIRKTLRAMDPDIVHGQGTERFCALSAVYSGYLNVLTIHGNMRRMAQVARARPFSFVWLAAKLETLALRRTGGVLCNSLHTKQQVAPLARRTWMAPNALRAEFFLPAPPGPPQSPPVLLNIGAILPNKTQLELVQMAQRLRKRGANFTLKFIGALDRNSTYGAAFAAEVKKAESEGWASHSNWQPVERIIEIMDSASALIHFPIEEAFGLVVAEALARNLKLFTTDAGGPADIAAGVEGSVLIPGRDLFALENAIFDWLASGHPRPKSPAHEMAKRYHPDIIAQRHIEIYQELLTSQSSAPHPPPS